ncbi:selenocysteine-specific translation elongation factor [Craterilacuibacter sp. RT1T]|uniref:selenocysteine-specific translation elongation factor n=1 Tax=Craterilacuibacter sp. RT1T TaxID=2942211 RepID=UPI0020BFABB8|nr:selenocysteine-specific translation elongation factor [Craterilacuibacter sp. RT1T]MCL6263803.1 selenocysteine-specific translation elongation factor [Craterilacuibacter sp. RT1T]
MIIATAGHVDHGKTSLLHALTGTNADRLPEEQRRGMTLDLGYAFLEHANGTRIGFIDVPGHERFLSNMLAGVGGLDHALLVVACDDGVMAQTREHLAILRLAGVPALTVALSKSDLATPARLAALQAEIEALCAAHQLPLAAVLPVSSHRGTGIDALRSHLASLTPAAHRPQQRFRLAIDRAFTIKGSGLVVSGTALSGSVNVGDTLYLSSDKRRVRVRALHTQGQAGDTASAGERIALNLAGDISKDDIRRGDWLFSQEGRSSARISVQLELLPDSPPLKHWQAVHIHHGARHTTGHLALLGDDSFAPCAELALDVPLYLADNDRLIVRDASARHTLAGARVLELSPPSRAKRSAARLAQLTALSQSGSDDKRCLQVLAAAGRVDLDAFAWARQRSDDARVLVGQLQLVTIGALAYSADYWQSLKHTLLQRLAELHLAQPDQMGAARSRLKRLALPSEDTATVMHAIDQLLQAGLMCETRGWLHLPQHSLAFTPAEDALWQRLAMHLASDDARWVRDLAQDAGSDEDSVRPLLKKAARLGHVIAIVPDRYYPSTRMHEMARIVRQLVAEHGFADAASFRNRIGAGRKLSIQILEFFDKSGLTRRQGDRHLLRDGTQFG